jgi:hypothetical protein
VTAGQDVGLRWGPLLSLAGGVAVALCADPPSRFCGGECSCCSILRLLLIRLILLMLLAGHWRQRRAPAAGYSILQQQSKLVVGSRTSRDGGAKVGVSWRRRNLGSTWIDFGSNGTHPLRRAVRSGSMSLLLPWLLLSRSNPSPPTPRAVSCLVASPSITTELRVVVVVNESVLVLID